MCAILGRLIIKEHFHVFKGQLKGITVFIGWILNFLSAQLAHVRTNILGGSILQYLFGG